LFAWVDFVQLSRHGEDAHELIDLLLGGLERLEEGLLEGVEVLLGLKQGRLCFLQLIPEGFYHGYCGHGL